MADKRISGLTAMTTVSKDDILLVVDDPAGTPTNKKITIEKFFSNVESTITYANVTAASNSTLAGSVFKGGIGVVKNVIVDGNVSVNGVLTMTGTGVIANLSSNLTPDTTITYDLGNTTASWRDAYVQDIKGHSGAITVSANATVSANLTTSGANVYINGTDLTIDANTTVKANLIVHSDSTNTVINSGNTHITSNTLLAGTDTTITSNLASSANLTHTGALGLFNGANLTSNANATFFGNVALGVTSGDGNPKGADTALLKIDAGNTFSSSNTTLQGTNTVISSNVTISGATITTSTNTTLAGTNTVISSNVTISSANVYINPSGTANVYLKGMLTTTGNTSLGDDLTVAGNVHVSDTTDSTLGDDGLTGSIRTLGGMGITKNLTVGQNLNVHGNIHANGNITADGGTVTLGDSASDTVAFNADIGSHIIPTTDSTYDLGTTTDRFRHIYVDDATLTGNVTLAGDLAATRNVSGLFGNFTDNVKISTDKSLQFRDDTEYIKSNADGEITLASATKVTITTTSLNTSANTTLAGETANVTANLFISGANTKISSANTTLDGTKTTIEGTDLVVTANTVLPQFTSNTILVTTGANTNLGGSVNISGNVEMSGTANIAANTFIGGHANVRGNVEVAMASVIGGNVTVGTTSAGSKVTIHANNNLIINSNNENEFIKIDTKKQEIISNIAIETHRTLSTSNGVYLKDDTSLVFGGQMTINDTTSTTGILLMEDGTAHDSGTDDGVFLLEDAGADRIFSNSTGLIFGGDLVLDNAELSSANGVINLGTYAGVANGVIRISDAYNLPNTAGANGQFLRLLNGNVVFASGTGTNLTDVVQDVTPQLGADLDLNGFTIGPDASRANTTIVGKSDGYVVIGSSPTAFLAHNMQTGRSGVNVLSPDTQFEVVGNANVSLNVHCSSIFVDNHNGTANGLHLNSVLVTSTAAELNTLDGYTGDVADFNKISGTSDTLSSGDLDAIENFEETVSATTDTVTIKDGNICLDIASHDYTGYGLKLAGQLVTSSAAEINKLDGLLATTDQLNKTQIVNDGQTQVSRFIHTDSENRVDFTALDGAKPGQVTVANVVVTGTTTSSSNTTGALKVTGGAGIAKSVNVGQKLSVWGNTAFNANVTIAGTVTDNRIFYNKATDDLNMKIRVVSIGTTSTTSSDIGATANNILVFGNGVKPTAFPDGQAYIYAKNVTGDNNETHIHTCDEGGNETKISPHNDDNEWEFYSKNLKTGKVVRINMERMIRKLEKFTGETFIEYE